MEFRLTYEGPLYATNNREKPARAKHKHEIRQVFHKQLKALWYQHPTLSYRTVPLKGQTTSILESLANNGQENGFRFVPLVNEENELICKLDILVLRPGAPSGVVHAGDIDNRLKTLIDALRKPTSVQEIGDATPTADEDPFFVLLQDDKLITHLAVEMDTLLEPISGDQHDVRLIITATVRTYRTTIDNIDYN